MKDINLFLSPQTPPDLLSISSSFCFYFRFPASAIFCFIEVMVSNIQNNVFLVIFQSSNFENLSQNLVSVES